MAIFHKKYFKKCVGFISCTLFYVLGFGQNAYVKSNPFPDRFFIENKGQYDHIDSNIAAVMWTGMHNIYLYKNQAGFSWNYFAPPLKKRKSKHPKSFSTNGINSNIVDLSQESDFNATNDSIQLIFNKSVKNPPIIFDDQTKSAFYWTFGPTNWNAYGFKRITYKNIYPNIDWYVEAIENGKSFLKYGFVLHPGANPNDIQILLNGGTFNNLSPNSVRYQGTHFALLDSGWNATLESRPLICNLHLNKNLISVKLKNIETPLTKTIEIDPYVSVIDSFFDAGTRNVNFSNLISQMDFDADGNAYVMSAAVKVPQIAKYDTSGKLQWIFSGELPLLSWTSGDKWNNTIGAFTVNKLNYTLYMGPGTNTKPGGPRIIRLNTVNGNYDNYISNSRADAPELWDLSLHGRTKSLIGVGANNSGEKINLFTVDPFVDSIRAQKHRFTDSNSNLEAQDIIRSVIDIHGDFFNILNFPNIDRRDPNFGKAYNLLYYVNDSLNGYHYKLDFSRYTEFYELANTVNHPTFSYTNRFNGLAVNDSFAFVYDGKVLIAVEKYTGTIRCIDSIDWHGGKRGHLGQSGIAADNCNHVFVGGDSANVLVYTFINDSFRLDTNIYLFSPSKIRKTIDIRFNELSNQLFVCGDSFTASFPSPFASSCSITKTFEVDTFITAPCNGDFIAHITDGDTTTDYTFQWINLSRNDKSIIQLNSGTGRFNDTLVNPRPGDTFELLVAKNYLGNGEYQKYIFTTGRTHETEVFDTLCAGDTFALRQHKVGRDSTFTHTLINRFQCDSVVTYRIHFKDTSSYSQSVTLCRGDSLMVGNHVYTDAGYYKDTLSNFLGCDSFVYSQFNIAQDTVYLNEHVCNTFFYQVGDSAFYKPGIYTVVMTGSSGCDSVVIADISMSRDTAVRIRPNICEGDSFMLLGIRYALSGNYEAQLPRFDGCDSIIRITLSVRPNTWDYQQVDLCMGDSLFVGSKAYTTAGNYTDTLSSFWGCDSIIESKVRLFPVFDTTAIYILCGDTSVLINNKSYNSSATFDYKHTTVNGCDSMVHYRILKTNLLPNFSIDTSQLPQFELSNLSQDAIKFIWSFDDGYKDSVNTVLSYQFDQMALEHRVCLQVIDSLGCRDSLCVSIPPSNLSFDLYNSFSPNNDGYNDRFVVKSNGPPLSYSLRIFNRWGAKVYQTEKSWTNNPDVYWNGRVMNTGPECPSGTYFAIYHLYLDGPDKEPQIIHGVITVVR